jgi:Na+:H+ antiporter, NhaA family
MDFCQKALGLFFGKQLASPARFGQQPDWASGPCRKAPIGVIFYGLALLTGIGFTMSLFVDTLAFPVGGYDVDVRIAVLIASLVFRGFQRSVAASRNAADQPKSTVTTS